MNILLITPPFTQLNTPYPATTLLKPFLEKNGHNVTQCDLGVELANVIFSKDFIEPLFDKAYQKDKLSFKAKAIASQKERYISSIDVVMRFMRGLDNTLATRIASRGYLPEAGRFKKVKDEELEWAFGVNGTVDMAKHIATLYIEDLTDFIADMCGFSFELVRYGQQLALSAPSFDKMKKSLDYTPLNDIDTAMLSLLDTYINKYTPSIVGFSVPFPGTLYAALRCSHHIKVNCDTIKTVIGGGYVNTELRSISEVSLFDYVDYITYDDGEMPLSALADFVDGKIAADKLVRTSYIEQGKLVFSDNSSVNASFGELSAPDFTGLPLDKYFSMIEINNPMHKLWSDGRWNKMTVAHGCYWAKCAFCDTSLDYIRRYEAPSAEVVVDRMQSIMKQTGVSGFHFTDEALPPKLLREMCQEILRRDMSVSFWGNIRFEKAFDDDMCELLSAAGCIAVSGGIEVASPRILKLINKGVTIEQAAKAASSLTNSGIMVHAYLMYGFPSQTAQECVDSLEVIRQMFEQGLIQSAFWHRYAMTIHSPSGMNPDAYGVKEYCKELNPFANNAIDYVYDDAIDWDALGTALTAATHNYMHGLCYDVPLTNWFGKELPRTKVNKNYIDNFVGEDTI